MSGVDAAVDLTSPVAVPAAVTSLSTMELEQRMRSYGLRSTSRAANIRRLVAIGREMDADTTTVPTVECPVDERLRRLIAGDARLYDRVLTFEPLDVTDMFERVCAAGIELKRAELIAYFEREGVLYAQAWRERNPKPSAAATRGSASVKSQKKKRRRAAAPATAIAQERAFADASGW